MNISGLNYIDEESKDYQQTLETLIANLPGFVYRCKNDSDWSMIYLSSQFYNVTGYEPQDLIGDKIVTFNEIICDNYKSFIRKKWDEFLYKRKVFRAEYQIKTKSGAVKWVLEHGRGVYNDSGEVLYIDGYIADITERKEAEKSLLLLNQDLQIAKDKAEYSDKLKSAFLANLSHEIRTPMNAILGFAQILKEDDLPLKQRNYFINIIFNSGCHLLSIINDIIEISKIETKQIVPNLSELDINLLMRNILEEMKVIIPLDKNIEIIYVAPKDKIRKQILTDVVKLKQVLTNLLTNAIKFTDKGFIKFGYSIGDDLEFFVQDTGVGIDYKYHDQIFERYRQIEKAEGKKGGSGLGLAISKAYVEMLGGRISLDSKLGEGSTFIFTIPYVTSEYRIFPEKKQSTPASNFGNDVHTLLIAEDDDTNFLYLSTLFTKTRSQIIRACNGQEAIDIVMNCKDINLVLMDIKMPIMDGYEALKMIRNISPKLPVVAQTAYALPEDERNIQKAGFDGYISKPIVKEKLMDIIGKLIK